MLAVRCEQPQVLDAVVALIAVHVIHDFFSSQRAPEVLLHQETMLAHVAVTVRVRMIRKKYEPIPILVLHAASLPRWIQATVHGSRHRVTTRRRFSPAWALDGVTAKVLAHALVVRTDRARDRS
jgi:hypothetical protein